MNATKKLICLVAAGATLVVAGPVFADPGRDRGYDYGRDHRYYSNYDRHGYRAYNRDYDRRQLVVVQRPIVVERPVYYAEPAPLANNNIGAAALIGAAIGGYIDNRQ
jgi:hypothetical protein